ncbi:MAG TPA: SMC family ATPase, partial [Stenomitos sp.]
MHIVSVELENIKRYTHDRFEFMLGTNAISGPNGAGKSTILEAIGFALFDSLPYKKEDFLKRGASTGTVRVTFESSIDQREYTVVRNTKSTYYVYDPETKTRVAEQKADVLSWLCEHLGVEPGTDLDEFFRTTIGVPQGTFTAIFMDTATRRKAVFDKILRVEEYRQSSDALKETGNHLQAQIVEANTTLAVYNDRLHKMPELEVQERQQETQKQDAESRLERGRKELSLWQGKLAEYDTLEKAIAQDQRDLAAIDTKLGFAGKERDTATQRVNEARQAAEELQTLEAPYQAYQAAEQELAVLEADRKTRDGLRTERTAIQRRLDEATFAVQTLKTQLAALASDATERETLAPKVEAQQAKEKLVTELKAQLTEAKAVEERLARTKSELGTWTERSKALETQLQDLDKLADAPRLVKSLETSLAEKQDLLKGLQAAELKHKELGHRRKLLEEAAGQQAKAIADHEKAIAAKEPLVALAEKLDALTEEGQALRDRLSAIEAEIARDQKAATQFNGNLCPILNVGCPILDGQSPEDYYREQIEANQAKAKVLNDEIL